MRSTGDQFDLRTNALTLQEAGLSQIVDAVPDVLFESGRLIFEEGADIVNIYLQFSGRSMLQLPGEPLQQIFSCPAESPRIYGIVEALAGVGYGYSLSTASPSRFRIVSTETMFSFLNSHAGASFQLSATIGRRYMNMVRALN